jgi:hypothetical protein
MDDGILSSSDDAPEEEPIIPNPFAFHLTDEDVAEYQRIVKQERGVDISSDAARAEGLNLLRAFTLILDPKGYERWLHRPPVSSARLDAAPSVLPSPEPFPIPFSPDHLEEVHSNLRIVLEELGRVKRRPNSWRSVFIALYKAIGHSLMLVLQPNPPYPEAKGFGHLTALYKEARHRWKDLPDIQETIDTVERARTTFVILSVARWPIPKNELPGVVRSALTFMKMLPVQSPGWTGVVVVIEDVLRRLELEKPKLSN